MTKPSYPSLEEDQQWESITTEKAHSLLQTPEQGLDDEEVLSRRDYYGENRLPEVRKRSVIRRFLVQFNNILIHVLIAAGLVTVALGEWLDASVIFGVVLINGIIGFIQEGKAEQAMESIRRMLSTRARVLRDGEHHEVDAAEIVPGDIILLESGDRVPADARLLAVKGLRTDESSLTGESVPVDKSTDPVEAGIAIADRLSMVWSGTLVTAGQGHALVTGTGEATELGRISQAAENAPELVTPLLRKIHQFGRQLTVLILALAALTYLAGTLWRGQPAAEMFFAAVSLAVAAIPEGLPAIITITLAIGVQAMARRNAIIRRLPAVETLGSVTVICSDKTGTLTRNEMTVRGIQTPSHAYAVTGAGYTREGDITAESNPSGDDRALDDLLLAGILCNDSHLKDTDQGIRIAGDPMEAALLILGDKAELDTRQLRKHWTRTDYIPFESDTRYMATLNHDHADDARILVKGAPERILPMCRGVCLEDGGDGPIDARSWEEVVHNYARQGRRTLAFAMKRVDPQHTVLKQEDAEEGLVLLGLIALEDPPRDEAIKAVSECREAGIRVKMITGDHLGTALAIGEQLGLRNTRKGMTGADFQQLDEDGIAAAAVEIDVFARFSPENKLTLVQALQKNNQITAMTGDGVNDSPALRSADVGVAMGRGGTEAAREASEVVLADDNFATIAGAVRTGRGVYDNIRKSLMFILPTNGGQALLILAAVVAGLTLPVTPVQVLWVNMVTAVTLALALTMEPTEPNVMRRPPRPPAEPIFTPFLSWRVIFVSFLILAATLSVFNLHIQDGMGIETARTAAVNTVIACQIFYLYNCRHMVEPILSYRGLTENPWVPGTIGIIVVLQLLFTYLPPMQTLFGTTGLTGTTWLMILSVSLPLLFIVELEKFVIRRWSQPPQPSAQAAEQ